MRKNSLKYELIGSVGQSMVWVSYVQYSSGRSGGQSGYAGIEARLFWASGDQFSLADHHNLRHCPLLYTSAHETGGSALTVYCSAPPALNPLSPLPSPYYAIFYCNPPCHARPHNTIQYKDYHIFPFPTTMFDTTKFTLLLTFCLKNCLYHTHCSALYPHRPNTVPTGPRCCFVFVLLLGISCSPPVSVAFSLTYEPSQLALWQSSSSSPSLLAQSSAT